MRAAVVGVEDVIRLAATLCGGPATQALLRRVRPEVALGYSILVTFPFLFR